MKRIAALFIAFTALLFTFFAPASAQETGQKVLAQVTSPTTESITAALKGKVPSGIQLLEDLSVTEPGPDVPTQLAELSGAWSGHFRGEQTNKYMADWVYVFEKLAPDSVTVVSMGVGRFTASRGARGTNAGKTWSTRYEGLKPSGNIAPLEVTNSRGTAYSFKLEGGKLYVRTVSEGGAVWVGEFEKITR
jgi:hypothetical protein